MQIQRTLPAQYECCYSSQLPGKQYSQFGPIWVNQGQIGGANLWANCKRLKSFFIFLGEDPSFQVKIVETNVPAFPDYCIISVLWLCGFFFSNFSTIAAKWLRKKLLKTQMQIRIVPSENIFNPLCGACASNIRKSLMATSHAKRQISEIAILQFSGYQQSQGCLVSFSIKTR